MFGRLIMINKGREPEGSLFFHPMQIPSCEMGKGLLQYQKVTNGG